MCCVVSVPFLFFFSCTSMCVHVHMYPCARSYKCAYTQEHKGQHFHFPSRASVMLL